MLPGRSPFWVIEKILEKLITEFSTKRDKDKIIMGYAYDEDRALLGDLYSKQGKPDDVIRVMKPIFYPPPGSGSTCTTDSNARMLYTLALLDKRQWEEAVAIYESTISANLTWQLPGGGPSHTFPNVHFDLEIAEYAALRAQAHLILGAVVPESVIYADADTNMAHEAEYMLAHLKQSLKYNSQSPDAHFLSGLLLTKLNRFDEARAELRNAAKYASDAAQPEIDAALKNLREKVIQQKVLDARKAYQALHPDAP